jgi:hypothetical protein
MDQELLRSIKEAAVTEPLVSFLSAEESQRLIDRIASKFVKDYSSMWWWDNLATPAELIEYEAIEWPVIIEERLAGIGEVYLWVTDDEPPPWAGIRGPQSSLLRVVGAQRFFEYFIANLSLTMLLFDTHHNSLVVTRSGLKEVVE